jgi:toxin ParE1/3/4
MKPVVRRRKADEDVDSAVEYLLINAPEYALAFVDSLQQAVEYIQKHPKSGPPRYAHELDIPGLRFWLSKRFPYMVFYMELSNTIEIWRVLHTHQDIPDTLRDEES